MGMASQNAEAIRTGQSLTLSETGLFMEHENLSPRGSSWNRLTDETFSEQEEEAESCRKK
jgi:hypothetical protein